MNRLFHILIIIIVIIIIGYFFEVIQMGFIALHFHLYFCFFVSALDMPNSFVMQTFRARDQQGELFIKVFLGNFWERYRAEELAVNVSRKKLCLSTSDLNHSITT